MSQFMRSICLALVLAVPVLAPGGGVAAGTFDQLAKGPKVGESIPHSLSARDQNNRYEAFKSLARRRGLIVLFSRSLDW